MATSRLEAFSDGVFAIAITLLVLEIHIPNPTEGRLVHALLHQWPFYASYVVSFLVIGTIWVNHHAMFQRIVRVDRPLLFINLLLLMAIAFIPFASGLLAEFLRAGGSDEHAAAVVYSGTMTAMGASFGGLWYYAARGHRLLDLDMPQEQAAALTRRFLLGTPVYAASIAIAFFSATACLAIYAAVAIFYVIPGRGGALPHRASSGA